MKDRIPPLTAQTLARIVLLALVETRPHEPSRTLRRRELDALFEDLAAVRTHPEKRSFYPFSDEEWRVLADTGSLWRAIVQEAGADLDSIGIMVEREAIRARGWQLPADAGRPASQCFAYAVRRLV